MNRAPVASSTPTSSTSTTLGCTTRDAAWASRENLRSALSRSSPLSPSGRRTFSATRRPPARRGASKTSPMPPRPRVLTTR
ncbi:MAG: hypothetical protein R3A52_16500 [Polyangiales bacterium]